MQVVAAKEVSLIDEYIMSMRREINLSEKYEKLTRFILSKIDVNTATKSDVIRLLESKRKPESEDPLHSWIGTYNIYVIVLKRFFKWLGNPDTLKDIKQLKRKEKSVYKPSDFLP